jgi:hypothetical protein
VTLKYAYDATVEAELYLGKSLQTPKYPATADRHRIRQDSVISQIPQSQQKRVLHQALNGLESQLNFFPIEAGL